LTNKALRSDTVNRARERDVRLISQPYYFIISCARACDRILKVARSIVGLATTETIKPNFRSDPVTDASNRNFGTKQAKA